MHTCVCGGGDIKDRKDKRDVMCIHVFFTLKWSYMEDMESKLFFSLQSLFQSSLCSPLKTLEVIRSSEPGYTASVKTGIGSLQ